MEKFNVVMLGAPGSGKGTQAKILAQEFRLAHVSTGDLFRKQIASGNALGQEAKSYIDRGALCPDSLTINMLHDFLSHISDVEGFILDGVPRTTQQAEMLEGFGTTPKLPVHLVLNLNVDQEEIARRMIKRAELEHRSDDTPEIIQKRIENYFAQTKPLEEYYAAQGVLRQINGMGSVEEISAVLCETVRREMRRR
ncbi:MAG: adenylate kinase [Bacteroidales bacterium]|nr:adenylate kinase [Bacteroidales bacterium]